MRDNVEGSVSRWKSSVDGDLIQKEESQRRKRMTMLYAGIAVIVLVFIGAVCYSLGGRNRPKVVAAAPETPRPAAPAIADQRQAPAVPLPSDPEAIKALLSNPTNPVVKITTGKGDMLVELFEDKVPNTVANMIELAEKGFYKGTSFHRVIPGFMAQGGCPNSKQGAPGSPGAGDPGYRFADEFSPDLKHSRRGIVSMANSGPGTNGSQFFICFKPANHLNGKHSVFGRVIAGEEVLDALEKIGTASGKTTEPPVRFNIEVVLKQDHPYHVTKL